MFAMPMPAISWLPVDALAAPRGESAREHGAVGEGDQRDAGGGQHERRDIRPLETAERGGGEALRECADDRQRRRQPEDRRERGGEDDHDQHARHGGAQPAAARR